MSKKSKRDHPLTPTDGTAMEEKVHETATVNDKVLVKIECVDPTPKRVQREQNQTRPNKQIERAVESEEQEQEQDDDDTE